MKTTVAPTPPRPSPPAERGKKASGGNLIKTLIFSAILAVLTLAGFSAWATNIRGFGVGNRAFGTTNGYAIVPAVGGRVALVQTLAVTTDQAPGRVVVYSNGPPAIVVGDHAITVSNIMVLAGTGAGGTNGLAPGDQLISHSGNTPNDRYDRLRVVSVSTTNILVAVTNSFALTAGSRLYRVSTNQVIVGVTNGPTSIYNSQCIAVGEEGQPLLIDIIGTSSLGQILGVGGIYLPVRNANGLELPQN